MGAVLAFPKRLTREPDTVRLGYDFGRWCVELYRGERFVRRIGFDRIDDARCEVEIFQASGMARLPDARPEDSIGTFGGDDDCA